VLGRQYLNFYPEKFGGKPPARVAERKESQLVLKGNDLLAIQAHVKNLIDAVQGRGKVIAPPEVGQQAAIGGHMATLSYKHGKKIVWDEKARKYHFV
jgi:hypothetical protein